VCWNLEEVSVRTRTINELALVILCSDRGVIVSMDSLKPSDALIGTRFPLNTPGEQDLESGFIFLMSSCVSCAYL